MANFRIKRDISIWENMFLNKKTWIKWHYNPTAIYFENNSNWASISKHRGWKGNYFSQNFRYVVKRNLDR
jgi:hypothetical protein